MFCELSFCLGLTFIALTEPAKENYMLYNKAEESLLIRLVARRKCIIEPDTL